MCLALMEETMLRNGRVFPEAAQISFQEAYLGFRSGYNRLSEQALQSRLCRWPLRPKHHYIEHLAYDTCPLNGRYLHNYLNEDHVRRIKAVAAGSHPAFLSKHVLLKYVLQACLKWR